MSHAVVMTMMSSDDIVMSCHVTCQRGEAGVTSSSSSSSSLWSVEKVLLVVLAVLIGVLLVVVVLLIVVYVRTRHKSVACHVLFSSLHFTVLCVCVCVCVCEGA